MTPTQLADALDQATRARVEWANVVNLRPGDVLVSTRPAGPRDLQPPRYNPRAAVAIVANVEVAGRHEVSVLVAAFLANGAEVAYSLTFRATANLPRLSIRDEDLTNLANVTHAGLIPNTTGQEA